MIKLLNKKNLSDIFVLFGATLIYFGFVKFLFPKNPALLGSEFHPFIFLSVIYSAYYGTKHALFACAFFTTVYFVTLSYQVDFKEVESLFLLRFWKLPIHITLTSLLVGEIRQRTWKRQKESIRKLERSEVVNRELVTKVKSTEGQLNEVQKRYATLSNSFEMSLKIFDDFEGKSFNEVVGICCGILQKECHAQEVSFLRKDSPDLTSEEIQCLKKVEGLRTTYSLKDDSDKAQEDRILQGTSVEIISPLILENEVEGYFLLRNIPFLSLNKYNQKKIESIIHLLEISLRNYGRRIKWESELPLLPVFNIFKREAFFDELSALNESFVTSLNFGQERLFYMRIKCEWSEHVPEGQRAKIFLILTHFLKSNRAGVAPIGGDFNHGFAYYSFISTKEDSQRKAALLMAQVKSILPGTDGSCSKVSFDLFPFDENRDQRLSKVK